MALIKRHLPAREFGLIIISLCGIAVLAWTYLIASASAMKMPGAGMEVMAIPEWTAWYFLLMFLMWAIMMIGMMVPTVIPTVLIYASVARKAAREEREAGSTPFFVVGYVTVWILFSVAATGAQWMLDSLALLSPMMVANSPFLGAGLLASAGIYQFLPVKKSCLSNCRSPVHLIARHWRHGTKGAFVMGIEHGLFCLGCCWVIMLLLFVGGVMNLLWIALITVFVLLEKVLPLGDAGGRIVGIIMIIAAGAFIYAGN